MKEGGPVPKRIYQRWGVMGLIVAKVLIVVAFVIITWLCMSVNLLLAWISAGLGTLYGAVPYPRLFKTWYWFYWRRDNL